MSVLQVSNLHFESSGNNRLQYTGSNGYNLVGGGSVVATINTTAVDFPLDLVANNVAFSNISFEATGNNRIEYAGSNTWQFVAGGANVFTVNTTSAIFPDSISVTGAATLSNTIAVTGNATFSNTVSVTGAATLSNTIAVTGNATFSNTVSVTGNLTISSGLNANGSVGTAAQVLTSNGSVAYWSDPAGDEWTYGTTAISGSGVTISGIPAGVLDIELFLDAVYNNGDGQLIIRLGDSGGLETSGYTGYSSLSNTQYTTSFDTRTSVIRHGKINISRRAASGNEWSCVYVIASNGNDAFGGGMKTLSGELTQIGIYLNESGTYSGNIHYRYK